MEGKKTEGHSRIGKEREIRRKGEEGGRRGRRIWEEGRQGGTKRRRGDEEEEGRRGRKFNNERKVRR